MRISVQSLQNAINNLPDATSYPQDEYSVSVIEPFDPDLDMRPATVRRPNIVFKKNFNRQGWDLVFHESAFDMA